MSVCSTHNAKPVQPAQGFAKCLVSRLNQKYNTDMRIGTQHFILLFRVQDTATHPSSELILYACRLTSSKYLSTNLYTNVY